MKTLTQSIATIAFLGTLTLGMSMDMDAQIKAISTASDAERIELVNQLKVELQSMTPEERQQVVSAVRAEIGVELGEGEGEQIRTQLRQRTQSQNANGTQQMQAGEQAAQLRVGSKAGTKQDQGTGGGMYGR